MFLCLYVDLTDYAGTVSLIKMYFQDVVIQFCDIFYGQLNLCYFFVFMNRTEAEHVYVVHPRSLRTVSVHPVARHLIVTASTDWYKCSINLLGEVILIMLTYKSM